MSDAINGYVCPQCGAEYEVPGVCETCQVTLKSSDEDDELEGFQTEEDEEKDENLEGLTEEDFMEEASPSDKEDDFGHDTYEDQDNY